MNTSTSRRSTRVTLAIGAVAVTGAATLAGITATPSSSAASDPASVTATASPTPAAPVGEHAATVDAWLHLWNGDYSLADEVVSPDVRVHAAMLDGSDSSAVRGPEGVVAWIGQLRTVVPDLRFSIEVGPVVDGDQVALRWLAEGTYAGGMPGAAAPAGTRVSFTGIDLLRLHDGQVVEYWLNADTLGLVTQLQVRAG